MFKVSWDRETGGVKLSSLVEKDTINISPRPVFYEELNLLGLNTLGWQYPGQHGAFAGLSPAGGNRLHRLAGRRPGR